MDPFIVVGQGRCGISARERDLVGATHGFDEKSARKLVVAPDGRTGETVTGVPGERAALVLAGSLEITIGPDVIVLEEGDAVQFNAETPHAFRNPGALEAQILWVVSQVPAERHI